MPEINTFRITAEELIFIFYSLAFRAFRQIKINEVNLISLAIYLFPINKTPRLSESFNEKVGIGLYIQ